MFCFFGPEAGGILASQPGIQPESFALEGKVLTHGSPGKSLNFFNKELVQLFISSRMSFDSLWLLRTLPISSKLSNWLA